LTPHAIESYLRREQPYDCAGSIKSEGLGIALVEAIDCGDPSALIGLPLISVVDLLREEGVEVLEAHECAATPAHTIDAPDV